MGPDAGRSMLGRLALRSTVLDRARRDALLVRATARDEAGPPTGRLGRAFLDGPCKGLRHGGGLRRTGGAPDVLVMSQDTAIALRVDPSPCRGLGITAALASHVGERIEKVLVVGVAHPSTAEDEKTPDLGQTKSDAGKAAKTDVLPAESQLTNDRVLLPPLEQQLSVANDALTIPLGRFPGEWSPPAFDLDRLTLPGELPVSLSSDLVHQRPDILASEASLHAASAAIGVATAQMYPSITLSASVGLETFMSSGMSAATSEMWNIASGITAPIFEGGALV